MRTIEKILSDNLGVTPVIGVMLMIVVTVILAAAVSSYAGSMESQDSAPQATFSTEASYSDEVIELNHLGGDTLYRSNIKIGIESGNPPITGYVETENVTFSPKADYLRPGDLATIEFIADTDWQGNPYTVFLGDNIHQSAYIGEPFRITLIDTVSGQTIFSTQLVMNP